jgi:hypothetical protein
MKILIYFNNPLQPQLSPSSTIGWGATEDYTINIAKGLNDIGHTVDVFNWIKEDLTDDIRYLSKDTMFNEQTHYDVVIGIMFIHFLKEITGLCTWDKSFLWISMPTIHEGWPQDYITQLSPNWINELSTYNFNGIVCNCKWHQKRIEEIVGNIPTYSIPPGISRDLFPTTEKQKIKNSFIWTSDPSRGLKSLLFNWGRITKLIPDATLKIFYPHYVDITKLEKPELYDWLSEADNHSNITLVGNVEKSVLYNAMAESEYWVYTTAFEETYCTTAMEMMHSKVKIITSMLAALPEVIGNYGVYRNFHEKVKCSHCDTSEDILSAIKEYNQNPQIENAYIWSNKNTYKHRAYDWNKLISK